tara:strand:+ start:419 stop:835 length:417 start_codon:yes stop_codon:yes gene_type:complete
MTNKNKTQLESPSKLAKDAGLGPAVSNMQSILKNISNDLGEKKIGFKRGPEYSEETEDLLNDFAKSTEMINKELDKKVINSDDPKVQEILNILDDNLDSEFIDDLEKVYNLIQELPDKPTEKQKIGFKQAANELYINK